MRRSPKRAASRFGWTLLLALLVIGPAWLVFASEPRVADDGAVNPLALIVPSLAALFVVMLTPQALAMVRRPYVAADHYALTVRPGVMRTLVLPWAQIAEIVNATIDDEPYLLVRGDPTPPLSGDWPRWLDQGHLRTVRRASPAAAQYHLAVPLADFADEPPRLLASLAACAPGHVTVAADD